MIEQSVAQIQETAVQKAASTSVAAAAVAWLPALTEFFQLLAAVVAVASGVMAFVWHRRKAKLLEEQLRQLQGETENEQPPSSPDA